MAAAELLQRGAGSAEGGLMMPDDPRIAQLQSAVDSLARKVDALRQETSDLDRKVDDASNRVAKLEDWSRTTFTSTVYRIVQELLKGH